MSIATCPHCGDWYDQDYDVEHEEMCKLEQENKNDRK